MMKIVNVMKASNTALRLRRFVVTEKDVPNRVLDSVKFSKKLQINLYYNGLY